jgi:hypothetical protein
VTQTCAFAPTAKVRSPGGHAIFLSSAARSIMLGSFRGHSSHLAVSERLLHARSTDRQAACNASARRQLGSCSLGLGEYSGNCHVHQFPRPPPAREDFVRARPRRQAHLVQVVRSLAAATQPPILTIGPRERERESKWARATPRSPPRTKNGFVEQVACVVQ